MCATDGFLSIMTSSDYQLTIFNTRLATKKHQQQQRRYITWVDKFIENVDKIRIENRDLYTAAISESLEFLNKHDRLTEEAMLRPKAVAEFNERLNDRVTVGVRKDWRTIRHYYLFDKARVRLVQGPFGEFLSIKFNKMDRIIEFFCNMVAPKLGSIVLRDASITTNVPASGAVASRLAYLRKFFKISRAANQSLYATGQINGKIVADAWSGDQFDTLLRLEAGGNSQYRCSQEIELIVGVVVEGVRISKKKSALETVYNKPLEEETFSLIVKPAVFFSIEN